MKISVDRRAVLASIGASAALPLLGSPILPTAATAGEAINYTAWSAAVDQVESHIHAFQKATGIAVNYANFPGAQFRSTLVTKFASNEPLDLIWMNDAWTPEFAEAGWITPIDDVPELMKYNDDVRKYCIDAMRYKGRQYGLVYYTDHMSFMYNKEMLEKAGFEQPPATWDEVVRQSLKLKQMGLVEFPLMLALTADAWLIEMIGPFVYSFGGTYTDQDGMSTLRDAKNGALAAATWMRDAINTHKIVSPGAVTTSEIDALKAFGTGKSAFAILPSYRIRVLNDPAQAKVAGNVRISLMPAGSGDKSGNYTCGWVRYYGLTPHARADKDRQAAALKLMEWFGGKVDDKYVFQKMLLLDVGVPFCTKSLMQDGDVLAFYDKWAGGEGTIVKQASMAVTKDVIAPWFGEWNETNNQSWQSIFLNQSSPAAGLAASGDKWDKLKKQFG
jgi:multiple sugar transport system substrate-binding protein